MSKSLCPKTAVLLVFLCSLQAYAQLAGSGVQVWEKYDPSPRESSGRPDQDLLNFHYGIRGKTLKKYTKHSKNKSHTLSLVHTSREDERIWEDEDRKISLGNTFFTKGNPGASVKIRKRPSIFTFAGRAGMPESTSDSIRIRFEDRNLYEMILLPGKAKKKDLDNIHSYLSIKYGISLEKGKYYSSEGKELWDPEKHKEFRYRPTGIGRDEGNMLYQKQSCNQEDRFLTIGKTDITKTNTENPSVFDNHNFVMWSDDNRPMALKADGNFKVVERNWEINFIGLTIPTSGYKVRISKAVINPDAAPVAYWIFLKSPAGETRKFQGVENGEFIDFSTVDFRDEKKELLSRFTFAVSPLQNIKNGDTSDSDLISLHGNPLSPDLNEIVLYPNPVKKGQEFTIVFHEMENLVISVYDGGGRLVKLEKTERKSRSYRSSLHVQGSYLINLTLNRKILKTFKLIVD